MTPRTVRSLEAERPRKRIALIAHDNKKLDLAEWARFNRGVLAHHDLVATGTTGRILEEQLGLAVVRVHSGPLGGDQQIGAMIAEGLVDLLVFFADPLQPMPHDPDVKALVRLAMVWNIPVACNRASADFIVSSPLLTERYDRIRPVYEEPVGDPLVS
ncbi:MAG TPA: methylglyoxal synthase [Acidimicrobiales bacterium]|nr:methylglyoxal synthase [Acidimicrobiales bacterium]